MEYLSNSKRLHLHEVTHDDRDRKNLSGEIAARYGIRIDENDPAFIVVTLNQHALTQATTELMKQIEIRLENFATAVQRTGTLAGKHLAVECKEHVTAIRSGLQDDILAAGSKARELVEEVNRVNTRAILVRYISVGALAGLLLFGTGVLVGAQNRMSWNGCVPNDSSRALAPGKDRALQGVGAERSRRTVSEKRPRSK